MDLIPSEHLYESIANDVAEQIRAGAYRPGSRLPSVRQYSGQKQVSVTTVLQAYRLLEDRGLIEARPQSGYYVRLPAISSPPEPEISSPQIDPCVVSKRELALMILHDAENPGLVQLGAALPNPELLPTTKLNRILANLARESGPESNQVSFPPGYEGLRVQVARRQALAGCNLSPADIVVTAGCSEAMELCLRAVCKPGDIVAIESPTFFGVLQSIEALGLQALEIPTHPRDGISLSALRFAIEHNPVKACLVVANFNNPLGSCIPDANKRELATLMAKHEIPLIEDDISGEIYFSETRPLPIKAYDKHGLVLLCSSFSKDVGPGYRIGWTAPGRFRPVVEWLKSTATVGSPMLTQMAVAEFIASGGYDHHLRRLRRDYAYSVEQMTQSVMKNFPSGVRVTHPTGGFVIWVQLPDNVDALDLYSHALRAGVTLAPGDLFSATRQYRNFIRLNAALWNREIERAIERLGDLARNQ